MERKRKGPLATPISARRFLAAAVPIKDFVGALIHPLGVCGWTMGEYADVCCCDGCYYCNEPADETSPAFLCLSKRSKAMYRLGVPPKMMSRSCRCRDCRFPGFGTIGDLMRP